ncbi:unnamed protein product [Oikopleura dioica]|uniref:Uncharacterized protein n=1 Tax=Oikopleura dioica TaxID=34765 RepID=E4XLC3_OIKDI|nr:unnamed protein product [Oikopleura dioica]
MAKIIKYFFNQYIIKLAKSAENSDSKKTSAANAPNKVSRAEIPNFNQSQLLFRQASAAILSTQSKLPQSYLL